MCVAFTHIFVCCISGACFQKHVFTPDEVLTEGQVDAYRRYKRVEGEHMLQCRD
jgi:hypothetical protein